MHLEFAGLLRTGKSTVPFIYRGALPKVPFSVYNILIWLLTVLIACTYLMFLYASYGSEVSNVFLTVDQAYFKSIVHFLEKHWSLFPATLENISNIETPYHHFDSQIKWLFTLLMPTNHAFFAVNLLICFFLGYSIFRLEIPCRFSILLLLFAFSVLTLPSPGEILQMLRMPLDFTIRSDIFHNSNTILALAILTYLWNKAFFIRLLFYSLSFYVKSPAVPAFFLIEIYLLFFSCSINQRFLLKNQLKKLLFAILAFFASYYFFFYSSTNSVSNFLTFESLISFQVRDDVVWLADGLLLYDVILFILTIRAHAKPNNKILIYFYYILAVFLIIYDSVGLVKINIWDFCQVEFFLRYALLMIILHLNSRIHSEGPENRLLNTIILSIIIFNFYLFAHFFGALVSKNYNRFSEYLDNSQLIAIASPITNENDIVAFNTVDSPIRKGKQRQLCGIIKNPLWVTCFPVRHSAKLAVEADWKILNQALVGKEKFPCEITWLILDKSKSNYILAKIYQEFFMVKETSSHVLLKKMISVN